MSCPAVDRLYILVCSEPTVLQPAPMYIELKSKMGPTVLRPFSERWGQTGKECSSIKDKYAHLQHAGSWTLLTKFRSRSLHLTLHLPSREACTADCCRRIESLIYFILACLKKPCHRLLASSISLITMQFWRTRPSFIRWNGDKNALKRNGSLLIVTCASLKLNNAKMNFLCTEGRGDIKRHMERTQYSVQSYEAEISSILGSLVIIVRWERLKQGRDVFYSGLVRILAIC